MLASSSPPSSPTKGVIVVVAKAPIAGKCKTRLIPLLGHEGSARFARALLSDVLTSLEKCSALNHISKILLYAPSDDEGLNIMKSVLAELGLHQWKLRPMISTDLRSSDLGSILETALDKAREECANCTPQVMFLGMDAPALPLEDIALAFSPQYQDKAVICPADDGGWGMLCVPPKAVSRATFSKMYWSHHLTGVSQIKALTDQGILVQVGKMMHDMDEPEDVQRLVERICPPENGENCSSDNSKLLHSPATPVTTKMTNKLSGVTAVAVAAAAAANDTISRKSMISSSHPDHFFTRQALQELGVLSK